MAGGSLAKSAPSPSQDDYQAQDDHRTLLHAGEVLGDPTRMKRVAAHHAKMTRGMQTLLGAAPKAGMPASDKTPPIRKRKSPRPYVTKRGVSRR